MHPPANRRRYSQPGWLATEGVCLPINVRQPVHLVKLDDGGGLDTMLSDPLPEVVRGD